MKRREKPEKGCINFISQLVLQLIDSWHFLAMALLAMSYKFQNMYASVCAVIIQICLFMTSGKLRNTKKIYIHIQYILSFFVGLIGF